MKRERDRIIPYDELLAAAAIIIIFFVDFFLVLGWRSFQFVKKLCV